MPMPTTRQGRFLFYKARAKRRLKKLQARYPSAEWLGNRATSKLYPVAQYPKQVEKSDGYPKRWGWDYPLELYEALGYDAPGHPNAPHSRVPWGPEGPPESHYREPIEGYVHRRVKSVPRVKYVRAEAVFITPPPPAGMGYYFYKEFYPSGRPNPHWPTP